MYDNLIAALRNVSEYDSGYAKLMYDAADAIEHMQKTILRLENELGIYDDLPMVDQSMALSKMEKTTRMRDFNTVKSDLIRHLNLSCQKTDGEILWYDGTLDVLVEFLSILHQKTEEWSKNRTEGE